MNGKRVMNRIIGLILAVAMCFISLPVDVLSASLDEQISTETDEAEVFDEYQTAEDVTCEPVQVSIDTGIYKDEVTGEIVYEEDPYPLDILIIDPDPEVIIDESEGNTQEESDSSSRDSFEVEIEEDQTIIDTATVSGDYTYTLSGNKATITKYEGSEENISVPDTLDEYPVVSVGSNAFSGNTTIKSVSIPDSVTSIGSSAFNKCTNLSHIDLSSNLTSIGSSAFYMDEALKDITLPASLTTIGSSAFNNTGITEITIPSTVTRIESYAFSKSITKIIFENGITAIPSNACYGAGNLETAIIPASVTKIGSYAFYQCNKLSGLQLPDNLTSIDNNAFYQCSQNSEFVIPASVTTIGSNAFYGSAKKIVFSNGMTSIPTNACYGASELEEVLIPNTVSSIGNYAFYSCSKLEQINLPDNLSLIGNYALSQCKSLKNVSLPSSLQQIGNNAFSTSKELSEIKIPAGVTKIGANAFYNSVKSVTFMEGMTSIPANACNNASQLTSVSIPDTVTSIGENAFYQDKNLLDIKLPDGLTQIESKAFYQCSGLENVQIPSKVTSIADQAFYGCSKLTSMILPEGLTSLGSGVFYNCKNLEVVLVPSTVTKMGQSIFNGSAKSVIFADGMTAIPDNACDGATNLTQIAFPNGLKSIGKRAFYGCTLLEQISLPEGTVSVGDSAFYGDTNLTIKLPKSLTTIGDKAFSGCKLVKECGRDAEWRYDQEENVITITGTGDIGDGTENICDPFKDNVQFVEIEKGITKVGDHSFEGMDNLTGVVIGENVKEIGVQAFDNCDQLQRVELSKELEKIDEKAFDGCDSVDTMIFTGNIPQIAENSLPKQELDAYYPKSSESYTETTRNKYGNLSWKIWDDTLPTRDVILVLDVSGSMAGKRIANLKEAVTAFSQKVGGRVSNTRIGIVTFATNAKRIMPFSTDVTRMIASSQRMNASGDTHYLKGFNVADELMATSDADIKSMIVFSDGAPSDSRSTILSRAEGYRNDGYYMYSVGLEPTDSNRELLINIAGDEQNYFEADDIESLIDRFVEMSDDIGRSGVCGDNVKWRYNDSKKELVITLNKRITGNGRMEDYGADKVPAWDVYADTLETIKIENGVTYIGSNAFSKLGNIKTVQISKTVTEIADGAFSGCTKLTVVNYAGSPEDWQKIAIGNNNEPLLKATLKTGVVGENAVSGVIVKPGKLTMNVNDTTFLDAEIYPKTATNKSVTWTSSNPSVAKVSSTGKVEAQTVGTTLITVTTDDGGYTSTCSVEVTNNIPFVNSLTLGGSETGIKVDNDVPIIGGKSFNLDLPASLPVNVVLEDGKLKIGVNIKKSSLYSYNSTEGVTTTTGKKKSIKEQFEEFKADALKADLMRRDEDWLKNVQDQKFLDANMPGLDKSVKVNCVGYLEGTWSDKVETIQGSVIFTISGSATVQHQTVIWVVPVTVNCEFDASGKVIANLGYNFSKAQWYGDIDLAVSMGIEPYAGIGFGEWLSGGVYGRAQTDLLVIPMAVNKQTGLKDWTLSGELGVKGYFAKMSGSVAIVDGTYYIRKDYQWRGGSNGTMVRSENQDSFTSFEDNLIVATLEPKDEIFNDKASSDGTLVSNVYNAAKPLLVTANGTSIMFYVADDSSKDLLNQTTLMYSIYNPSNDTYSNAKEVLSNQTADYEPEVYTDGNDIYVVWLDSSKTFNASDDPSLADYMKTFRTHVARYNASSDTFEDLGSPQTDSSHYTYLPKLYKSGDALQLVWVENKDDSLLGLSSNNTIFRSVYEKGTWSVVDEINGLNSVMSLDIGQKGSSSDVLISYVTDPDNDLKTENKKLYEKKQNGSSSIISEGNLSAVQYTQLPGINENVLAINKDGGLYYHNGSSLVSVLPDGTMNSGSRFFVSGDKVAYLKSWEGERGIAVSTYDNGDWGSAALTHENGYVDSFSVSDGRISYLHSDATSKPDGTWDVTSSVKVKGSLDYDDVELEDVDYAVEDLCEGATLPVVLYIKNNGLSRMTQAHTTVTYGGGELSASDISVDLMPGEVKAYDYSFQVPAVLSSGGDFVITTTNDSDMNSNNNSKTISLQKADLEVNASYDTTGTTPYINITVENRGLVDSNMTLTVKDENGKTLFTKKDKVTAGNFVSYKEAYTQNKEQILTITAVGDAAEFYEMNNTTWLRVGDGQEGPEPVVTDSFSVGFINTVTDPYDGLTYNSSSKRYEAVYSGSAITPEIVVTGLSGRLTEGIDYTVKYSNNVKVDKNGKPALVTISGKGNYAGKTSLEFYILQANLETAKEKGLITIPGIVKVISGKKITPFITFRDYVLKAGDMDISNKSVIKDDTKTNVTGKGNFAGKIENISIKPISSADAKSYTIKSTLKAGFHAYNGKQQELTYAAAGTKGELTVTAGGSKVPLIKGRDYDVEYYNNVSSGTAKVVIKGKNDYIGTETKTFKIQPNKTCEITAVPESGSMGFDPKGVVPSLDVEATLNGDKVKLSMGKDYTIAYSNNKNIGTGKYTVKFLGNYKGHASISNKTFGIGKASFKEAKAVAADMIYTKPGKYLSTPFVTFNGVSLSPKDYTFKYYIGTKEITSKDNLQLDAGTESKTVTIRITGKGNFDSNEIEATYRVIKADKTPTVLTKAKIVALKQDTKGRDVAVGTQAYTGEEVKPAIRVMVQNGKVWEEVPSTAYDVAYINNVNKGKASILITGNGTDAIGSKLEKFTIGNKNLGFFSKLLGK